MLPRSLLFLALAAAWIASFGVDSALAATQGEGPRARLVLDAGALEGRCVSAAELERSVQAALGRSAFDEPALATLEVRVRIEQSRAGRFRAVVTSAPLGPGVPDAQANGATREIEAAGDCRALDEPLALVVALLVDADPVPLDASEPVAVATEPEPNDPPAQDTSPVSSAPSWEARAEPWSFAVGAGGVAAFGLLPDVGWGAELEGVAVPPGWPALRARVLGFLPGEVHATRDAWIEVTWLYAGIAVCPELSSAGRFALSGCLGADVTFAHVVSHGLTDGTDARHFGAQASASAVMAFRLSTDFRAVVEVGTAFPFTTRRYSVSQSGRRVELYETPPGQVLLSLGLAYDFH